VADLQLGDSKHGSLQVQAPRTPDGYSRFFASIKGEDVRVGVTNGSWTQQATSQSKTNIVGYFYADDTGLFLKSSGLYQGMEGGRSNHDVKLQWSGAPWDFDASHLDGSMKVRLENGDFQSIDSPIVKLIDLLTLKNFKFYEKGTKIKEATGTLVFQNGGIKLQPLRVMMPAAKIYVEGEVKGKEQTIAVDVGMEINIANTVEVATAAVLFGPAGAVASYFATEGLNIPGFSVLNRLSSFSYRLDGPWAKPKITKFRSEVFKGGIKDN
jgi:uncharacterized protein YhdP